MKPEPLDFDAIEVPTLHETVSRHARAQPDRPAVRFRDRVLTYAELDALADKVGAALRRDGLTAGDRIVFVGRNSDAVPVLALGANKAGIVPVPLNWRLAPAEIDTLIRNSGARLVFVEPEFEPAVRSLRNAAAATFEIVDARGLMVQDNWLAEGPLAKPAADARATAVQIYTSGTTGLPKGVMLSHRNLLGINHLRSQVPWDSWCADDVTLVSAPLGHIGAYGMLARSLFFGGEAIIHEAFDASDMLDAIAQFGVSKLALVPTAIKMLLDHPRANEVDYSRIKTVIYGASPITLELLQRAITVFDCQFAQSYGMSETSGPVVALAPEDHAVGGTPKMASAGRPLPATEVKIVDPDGNALPPGENGEICIRSIANMTGYWNRPEDTPAVLSPDGWLRTGDAGCLGDDGYVYVRTRIKEMIISGAENIYPAEVENAIAGHPDVGEVAVIGVPDAHWGEAVKAIVVAKPDHSIDPISILAWAREKIAGYKVPKSIEVVSELPTNATGKIDKHRLKKQYIG